VRHQKKEKRQRHSFTTIWTLLEREGFPYFTLSTLLSPLGKDVLSRPLTKHGKQGIYTHPLSFSSLIKDVMIDHIAQHRSQKIHLQNQAALRVEHLANLFSQSPILSVFWPLSGGKNSSMLYTSFDGNKFRLSVEDDLPSGKAPTLPPPSLLHTLVRAALGTISRG